MAIRIIRKEDDPVLRKISKVVENFDDRLHALLDDMVETMHDADGVGLAAPQVGILKRVIVIDIGDGLIELINPEIIFEEGAQCDTEGCLSLPGESAEIKRPTFVRVKGFNRKGEQIVVEGEKLLARALCHEVDHLNGILFTDRIDEK